MIDSNYYSVSKAQYSNVDDTLIAQLGKASEFLSNAVAGLVGSKLVQEPSYPVEGTEVKVYRYKTQITYAQLIKEDFTDITTLLAAEVLENLQSEPGKVIKPFRLVFAVPNEQSKTNVKLTDDSTFILTSQISLV